ncbi:MAG: cytochrome P450, partial [Burkholderiaceae bacterium]
MPDRALAKRFDIEHLDAAFYENPFPTYRALREYQPVKRMPNGSMFITRYADLVAIYKDTQRFSSDKHEEFAPKYG